VAGPHPMIREPLSPERLAAIAIAERQAMQKPTELSRLLALVADLEPRRVIEIGTYRGGTLWCFAQLATSDAVLVSVDVPGGDYGGGYGETEARRFRNFCRHEQRIVTVTLDSHDPATVQQVRAELGGEPADLLFIDGDHSYDGVKVDFELYSPLVRRGGLVAFHDIIPHARAARCEVDRLWSELRDAHRSVELIAEDEGLERGRWAGIGVLWIE
jgi:predicted O-methyltransferase YrrM